MDAQAAQRILQALAQGFDPLTSAPVPAHEASRRPEVIEALALAVAALEQEIARARRRAALPPNVGMRWTPADDTYLVREFRAGSALEAIAAAKGRSLRSIEARLEMLGELSASERSTRNLFARPRGAGST